MELFSLSLCLSSSIQQGKFSPLELFLLSKISITLNKQFLMFTIVSAFSLSTLIWWSLISNIFILFYFIWNHPSTTFAKKKKKKLSHHHFIRIWSIWPIGVNKFVLYQRNRRKASNADPPLPVNNLFWNFFFIFTTVKITNMESRAMKCTFSSIKLQLWISSNKKNFFFKISFRTNTN